MSAATRARVLASAERLGYRPDPALSALAAYRTTKLQRGNLGTLAYLHPWKDIPGFDNYAIKAFVPPLRERARKLGYELEIFPFFPSATEQKRLSNILYSRGIVGVFVGEMPMKYPTLDHFDWDRFAGVGLDTSLKSPLLPCVSDSNPRKVDITYGKLREAGYRKIGFLNRSSVEEIADHRFLATYLKCLYLDGLSPAKFPPHFYHSWRELNPIAWLNKHHFDAVITTLPEEFLTSLEGSDYHVPENLGLGSLFIRDECRSYDNVAGCIIDWPLWAEVAADLMHKRICTGDRGVGTTRPEIFFDTTWREGRSARRPITSV